MIEIVNESKSQRIEKLCLDSNFKVKLNFSFFTIPTDSNEELDPEMTKLPEPYSEQLNKIIHTIQMFIKDEVVAARRKQAVITKEVLQDVANHISEPTQRHYKTNLVCREVWEPLRFVSYSKETGYEESINEFQTWLDSHGNFGNRLSNPADLFCLKEKTDALMTDYRNFQFDLKKEAGFYYVTLRPKEDEGEDDELDATSAGGHDSFGTPECGLKKQSSQET